MKVEEWEDVMSVARWREKGKIYVGSTVKMGAAEKRSVM
jgi:hypothetical protein